MTEAKAEGVAFRIDYLAVTFHGLALETVFRFLVEHWGPTWEWKHWDVMRDDTRKRNYTGPSGAFIEDDRRQLWVHLALKGRGCAAVGTERLLAMARAAKEKWGEEFKATRVDVAWDDHSKRITPASFRERFWDQKHNRKRPEVLCRALRGHAREDDGPARGSGYQIGERVSERLLRVYDKAAESGGKIDATRVELETHKLAACVLLGDVCAAADPVAAALRHLVAFIDFRVPGPGRQARPGDPRCPWWAELVKSADRATLSRERKTELDEWAKNYGRQCAGGFRVWMRLHGGDPESACTALLEFAPRKLNPRHKRLLAEIEAVPF